MTNERIMRLSELFETAKGVLRNGQLLDQGFCSKDIQYLVSEGWVVRLKNGYYAWAESLDELSDRAIVTATIPNSVLCFVSAASFYGMTTMIADRIYVAIPNRGKLPISPDDIPVAIFPYVESVYALGITHVQDGNAVIPIYDRERTVCDCVRKSDLIGTDIMLEVIKSYMQGPRDLQKLYSYAKKLRILKKVHPYLEALS